MTVNVGNTPPDFNSPTGQFRLLAQDIVAIDLNPPVSGEGQYSLFSDLEIAGFMGLYPDSLFRAVGTAYKALAGQAALKAKIVKDFDLQVDLTKRAAALSDAADAFFARADEDDLLSGARSTFGITVPSGQPSFRELVALPTEQWAFLYDEDIPLTPEGAPPYLWDYPL